MRRNSLLAIALALTLAMVVSTPAFAHRPYFEEEDLTAARPWLVKEPTISTVVYATLESSGDVDYYTFEGKQGERILLEITIPQIEGQESFAPSMALLGPGGPGAALPARVERPAGASGALLFEPPSGPASTFFEPFSRTSYWEQQSQRVTLPADGRYVVAIWHPTGETGRYGFVIGDKERPGGDVAFMSKLRAYWTPFEPAAQTSGGAPGNGDEAPMRCFWLFCFR